MRHIFVKAVYVIGVILLGGLDVSPVGARELEEREVQALVESFMTKLSFLPSYSKDVPANFVTSPLVRLKAESIGVLATNEPDAMEIMGQPIRWISNLKEKLKKSLDGSKGSEFDMHSEVIIPQADPSDVIQLEKILDEYFDIPLTILGGVEDEWELSKRLKDWARRGGFNEPIIESRELAKRRAFGLFEMILKLSWPMPFKKRPTTMSFYNLGKHKTRVKSMCSYNLIGSGYMEYSMRKIRPDKDGHFRHGSLDKFEFRVIDLNLGDQLSFTIFQPLGRYDRPMRGDNGTIEGRLDRLIEALYFEPVKHNDENFGRNLHLALQDVGQSQSSRMISTLCMPKFSILTKYTAEGGSKDLRDISSRVRTSFSVDEDGVRGSGSNLFLENKRSGRSQISDSTIDVSINSPFFFLVRHGHLPLLSGRVAHLDGIDDLDEDYLARMESY